MKPLPVILGLGLLVVLGAVGLLLHEPGEEAIASGVTVGAADEATQAPGEGFDLAPVESQRESMPVASLSSADLLDVDVERPMPASYREALGAVVGRLVEVDGSPVPGLTVEIIGGGVWDVFKPLDFVARGGSPELDLVVGSVTSGADGRFRFEGLEPRILGALVIDGGGARTHLHPLDESPVSGASRDIGDVVMPAGVTIVGRVVDERDEPLSGVRVRATDLQAIVLASGVADYRTGGAVLVDIEQGSRHYRGVVDPPASIERVERLLPFPTTHTDDEGRFELPAVRIGLLSVVADDGRHLTRVKGPFPSGEVGSTRDLGDLVLLDGIPVSGRVVDHKGKPVPGAEVMVGNQMLVAPVALLRPSVFADESGRFTVNGLRDGAVRGAARAASHHEYTVDNGGTSAGGDIKIVLPGRRTLTLTLVDDEDTPIENVRFVSRLLPFDEAEEVPDFVFTPKMRTAETGISRDDEGRWILGDMDPGRWDVLITADGYTRLRREFDLTHDDLSEQIEFTDAVNLAVHVVGALDGEPVEYARVSVRRTDDDRDDAPQPIFAARTSVDGRAVMRDLNLDGKFTIEVEHPGLAVTTREVELPLPEGETELLVEMQIGGTILGKVIQSGGPPTEPLMVTLTREDKVLSAGVIPRMTATAPDGTFSFFNVEPGELKLEARDRFAFTNLTTWWEPLFMSPHAEGTVWVESGAEAELTLEVGSAYEDVETGFVEGRLTVNGQPATNWKVRTFGKIRRSVSVASDGRFTLGDIAAGQTTLTFNAPGQAMTDGAVGSVVFELEAGDRHFEETNLSTGSVEGQVWSSVSGQPIPGASVSLEFQGEMAGNRGWWGQRAGATATDAEGRFTLGPVAEGSYVAKAEADGLANAQSEVFNVSAMRPTRGVEVRLSQSVSLSGQVVFEDLEGTPEWIWLNATNPAGDREGARVDTTTFTYHFDKLSPDMTWTIRAYTDLDIELTTVERYVRRDETGVGLVFKPAPMDENEELDELDAGDK